jgi:hypothetical protein
MLTRTTPKSGEMSELALAETTFGMSCSLVSIIAKDRKESTNVSSVELALIEPGSL